MNTIYICITGPESTGKSTMAQALAHHYKTQYIPEIARTYLEGMEKDYTYNDVLKIADLQEQEINNGLKKQTGLVIADTDLSVIQIWLTYKYQKSLPNFQQRILSQRPTHYLLMDTDLPWAEDPLREHPNERDILLKHYHNLLINNSLEYTLITGTGEDRIQKAMNIVDSLHQKTP